MQAMQTEIDNLRRGGGGTGNGGYGSNSGDLEKVELEVKLKNAELRVEALQNQLDAQSVQHAQEISQLRQGLLEKESMLETMQGGYPRGDNAAYQSGSDFQQ